MFQPSVVVCTKPNSFFLPISPANAASYNGGIEGETTGDVIKVVVAWDTVPRNISSTVLTYRSNKEVSTIG